MKISNQVSKLNIEQFSNEKLTIDDPKDSLFNDIADKVNYEETYNLLVQALKLKISSMLNMFGGAQILDMPKMKLLTIEKILHKILNDITDQNLISKILQKSFIIKLKSYWSKLSELSPTEVKEIIAKIIKKHLGWLVVWGGLEDQLKL